MSGLIAYAHQQSSNDITFCLQSKCIKPLKATTWVWQYFGIYKDGIQPTLACCETCLEKAKAEYHRSDAPAIIPLVAYWEVKNGKDKSTA